MSRHYKQPSTTRVKLGKTPNQDSDFIQKFKAMRSYLFKKYGVYSLMQLKERGKDLLKIRKEVSLKFPSLYIKP